MPVDQNPYRERRRRRRESRTQQAERRRKIIRLAAAAGAVLVVIGIAVIVLGMNKDNKPSNDSAAVTASAAVSSAAVSSAAVSEASVDPAMTGAQPFKSTKVSHISSGLEDIDEESSAVAAEEKPEEKADPYDVNRLAGAGAVSGLEEIAAAEASAASASSVAEETASSSSSAVETASSAVAAMDPNLTTSELSESVAQEGEADVYEQKPVKEVTTKQANRYFKGCCFIGDSRTQGLQQNSGITKAKFLADRGLNVSTIYTTQCIREGANKITVMDALAKEQFTRIYIGFGLNELGWVYPNIFAERYGSLVDDIRVIQPNAKIIVTAILPVTAKRSHEDEYHNKTRIDQYNELIKEMCEEHGVTYVDLAPAVQTRYGNLPVSATTDGMHLNKLYCKKIIAYMVRNKI